ncbi:membrane protein, putative [Babesia bigemina]|uniref:Membrane protein, putative n=1 Tax=Babesia bigemina TaxID=5866 RepID=A0A061DAG2_BABBI|nr:membrane protein, putative [Babesia bigemina]CDR94715.1 membrane protein, putative [Babesia bigemina]|eukprot:XP_012766901.1 membrane protein, putative [Babesia bigemina]
MWAPVIAALLLCSTWLPSAHAVTAHKEQDRGDDNHPDRMKYAGPILTSMCTTTSIGTTGTGYSTISRIRTSDFMRRQDGMLIDARASLFQRALYNTTHPRNVKGFTKQPPDLHDRLHSIHDGYYSPIPAADFININEPYYYELLAEQVM